MAAIIRTNNTICVFFICLPIVLTGIYFRGKVKVLHTNNGF
jgi:hypothetical protein